MSDVKATTIDWRSEESDEPGELEYRDSQGRFWLMSLGQGRYQLWYQRRPLGTSGTLAQAMAVAEGIVLMEGLPPEVEAEMTRQLPTSAGADG